VKWYGTNTDIEARKTAEQAVAVQNTRLQLLLKLTKQITSNLELREVLRAISASIREVMHCDAVHISLPDPASGQFRVQALGFPEVKGFVKEELIIEPVGAAKRAFETLEPAVRNTANRDEFPPELYELLIAEGVKTQCVITPRTPRPSPRFSGDSPDHRRFLHARGDRFSQRGVGADSHRD